MTTLTVIVAIIIILFVIMRIRGSVKKHTAAMNALVAKATYSRLPEPSQKEVVNRASLILERDGHMSTDMARQRTTQMVERERYGFFALAMAELGVEPISQKWQWQPVSNPFVALIRAEEQIKMAQIGLQKEGIAVGLGE